MYSFNYVEKKDFGYPTEISMSCPERTIDEMCEYFQRFLSACGYVFDEGEHIKPVKNSNNTLAFDYGTPQPISADDYFFGGDDHIAFTGSGVRGGMASDIISFS